MNETDVVKATIVSLYPLPINSVKPGLYPGHFFIPAAPLGDLTFLVVGDSVHYMQTQNEQMIPVRTSFMDVAKSIVDDFQTEQLGRIIDEDIDVAAEPGLFWVHGALRSKDQIRRHYQDLIDIAEKKQNNWFKELIKIGDDTFSRTQRSSAVSQLQRLAAERLGVQRPWMIRTGDSRNSCPFCKAEMPYGALKCPNCREIVDPIGYAKLVEEIGNRSGVEQ